MKKKDLILISKELNLKGLQSKKKHEIEIILKNKKIEYMTQKSLDSKDPISLEPFEEWDLSDLLSSIFIHGYFYKKESICNYINSISNNQFKDPINPFLFIPNDIVQSYYRQKSKKLDFTIRYDTFHKDNFNFYFMIMYISSKYKIHTSLPKRIIYDDYFILLGILPSDISVDHQNLKSLDTSSTSDCLLYKIIYSYESEKLIQLRDNGIHIQKIDSLPIHHKEWILNNSIDTLSINSVYQKLVKNIEDLQ